MFIYVCVFSFSRSKSSPQELQKPEVGDLYLFAVEEMEKEVGGQTEKNVNIRQTILLAQLYGMLSTYGGRREAFERSAEQYDRVLSFAPQYVYTYPTFANMLAQTGNLERAIDLINKAESLLIDADRSDDTIFYSKPLFYTANRQYDEAYRALEKLSSIKGAETERRLNPVMMENIIRSTVSQGQEAIPFLEKVYALDRNIFSIPLMLAQIHAGVGNTDEARRYASEALALNPGIEEEVNRFFNALEELEE